MLKVDFSDVEICMLASNEEDMLPSVLPQIANVFPRFTFLYQESDDRTLQIISEILGGKANIVPVDRNFVRDFGFAAARNRLSEAAERPWLLHVDADELITFESGAEDIRFVDGDERTECCRIPRHNLRRPPGLSLPLTNDEILALPVDSAESHTRFYKNHTGFRWRSFIHEELWHNGSRTPYALPEANITFQHLSRFKNPTSAVNKEAYYGWMLIHGSKLPPEDEGALSDYCRHVLNENKTYFTGMAEAYEQKISIGNTDKLSSDVPFVSEKRDQMPETFDLRSVRTLHSYDAEEWLGQGRAYWLEWDHPGETSRPFAGIVDGLKHVRWPQLIKPGSLAIDVGTHSGDTTIPMGLFAYDRTSGKKGHVIGVEPNPHLHPILEACLALNEHVAHFHLEKCAITAEDLDEVELSDHANSNCNGGVTSGFNKAINDHLAGHELNKYYTKGKTLQTILNDYRSIIDPRSLQFIKTDCEGYDQEILLSSKEVLSQLKPALFIEWFAWFTPDESERLFQIIDEVGYVALHPGTLERVSASGQKLEDLTCIHKDRIGEISP